MAFWVFLRPGSYQLTPGHEWDLESALQLDEDVEHPDFPASLHGGCFGRGRFSVTEGCIYVLVCVAHCSATFFCFA